MANLQMNDNELKKDAYEINKLIDKYEMYINEFFDVITLSLQKSWQGNFANDYISKLPRDKQVFLNYGKYMRLYPNILLKAASEVKIRESKVNNR